MAIQTNLYDTKIYFALIFQGVRTYILEPKGWDTIENNFPRDPRMWGFSSDFLEDKYGMLFTFLKDTPPWSDIELTGGADLLKYIYETPGLGPNETVFFEFGEMLSNTPHMINSWRIVFDDYNCDVVVNGGVAVSIERMPFQAKYRARMSAPCTVNTYSNMDGELLTPISSWQLRLHSKALQLFSLSQTGSPRTSNEYVQNGNPPTSIGRFYTTLVQPDLSDLQTDTLKNVFNQPLGLIDTGTDVAGDELNCFVFTDQINQFTPQFSGTFSLEYKGSFKLWFWCVNETIDIAGSGGANWVVTPRIVVQRIVGGVPTIVNIVLGTPIVLDSTTPGFVYPALPPSDFFPQVPNTGGFPSNSDRAYSNSIPFSWDETSNPAFTNILLEAQDCVYVHLNMQADPLFTGGSLVSPYIGCLQQIEDYFNYVRFSQLTVAKGSTADGFRIFDVINQQLENLTGFKNRLISPFFSEGGFGYKYLLTNGYGIRNYGGIAYKFKKDLESTLQDLQAKFFIGMGMQNIDGEDYMVIDYAPNFLRKRTIAVFTDVFEWIDKHNASVCYNKAELGFNKYEGLNIVQQDEFCTQGAYLVSNVKYNNNTLSAKSNMVGSGYLLEVQRRNQFLANPGQSLTNDEDIFIVATAEPCVFSSIAIDIFLPFYDSRYIIRFGVTSMALNPGDKILINTAFNPNATFTVSEEEPGYPIIGQDSYFLIPTDTPSAETITTDVQIKPPSPNQVFAERNQPFEICENVVDPSTIYNGRLSLKHIRAAWRPLLGVGLYFLDPGSQDYGNSLLVTTQVKMNSLFTTKFLSTEPNKGNVGDKVLVELKNDFIADYLQEGENLFTPIGATCKVKIGWNEMNTLRKALCGELGDDTKDFGGIVLRDTFGVDWFCHVMIPRYNFVTQIATFDIQKVEKVTV